MYFTYMNIYIERQEIRNETNIPKIQQIYKKPAKHLFPQMEIKNRRNEIDPIFQEIRSAGARIRRSSKGIRESKN